MARRTRARHMLLSPVMKKNQDTRSDRAPVADHTAAVALKSMMDSFQSPLLGYVTKLIGSRQSAAQDIVQEVFLRAFRKMRRDGQNSIKNPRCWLFRVAHNLAMDTGRKRGRQKNMQDKLMHDPVTQDNIFSRSTAADYALGRDEMYKLALQAVDELPEEQRNVVLLKIMQDMTLKQISEITGMKIGTVNYRLTQALRSLAEKMKKIGFFET